jgi:hypothetical protein
MRWDRVLLLIGGLLALAYLSGGGSKSTTTGSATIKTDLRSGILDGKYADVI